MTHSDDNDKREPTRDGHGNYARGIETAARDAEAARLRSQGKTYREIAEALNTDSGSAYRAVERAMDAVIREPAEQVIAYSLRNLAEERARLNDLRETVAELVDRGQPLIIKGEVLHDEDGEFTLKAIDRLIKIDDQLRRNDESRRKLEGLDQPAKTNISGGVTYEIIGMTPTDS